MRLQKCDRSEYSGEKTRRGLHFFHYSNRCRKGSTDTAQRTYMKDGRQFRRVFNATLRRMPKRPSLKESVLILGATDFDKAMLEALGFQNVTLSYFGGGSSSALKIDAEDIALPNGSFDMVFAHEVLHHVRSPHRALCEMLRVARQHVIFMEPNDSFAMRMLTAAGFSFPFEILSVQAHGFQAGGVRDTNVPNYIYRWNRREVEKTVSSYLAETGGAVHASGYWDFSVDDLDLSLRASTTRLQLFGSIIGERRLLSLLRGSQRILNGITAIRQQGNKFFCVIDKQSTLRPWLKPDGEEIVFDRGFSVHRHSD